MGKKKEVVLVVEDDAALRVGLEMNLAVEGYKVVSAPNAADGMKLAREQKPDLIILDLMLPDSSGLEVLEDLRAKFSELPVIILSAKSELEDKVEGLQLGADDYLTKPFELPELLARIDAALRRKRMIEKEDRKLYLGNVVVELGSRRVIKSGQSVHLTPRELDLLILMSSRPGRAFSRAELLSSVWGYDYDGTERTVDNFIASLRQKLEPNPEQPRHFITVRGMGYRFEK
jgi:DNA-binding response OmpR family regulator